MTAVLAPHSLGDSGGRSASVVVEAIKGECGLNSPPFNEAIDPGGIAL